MASNLYDIPTELYSQFHERMPIVCVDIVINIDDKILLVKRDKEPEKGNWWFPGGRLIRNESLKHAVSRIAKAETNISVVKSHYIGCDETIFEADPFGHDMGTHTINFVFVAQAPTLTQVVLDANHIDYSIFTLEEIWHETNGSYMHPYIKRFAVLSEGVFGK